MDSLPHISVVVPLYNEAGNVGPLVRKVQEALPRPPYEIELILVNDGSTDDTGEHIRLAQQGETLVRAVHHPRNRGQSAALFSGFNASLGNVIATLDGDLQDDPAELPRMLKELGHCDMVCGVRINRADGTVRRLSSRVARWGRKLALGVDFADAGCNLRVFRRGVLATLPAFQGVHRFMPILASSGGAVVSTVPVRHNPRRAGCSKYGIWNRLGVGVLDLLMVAIFIRRSIRVDYPWNWAQAPLPDPAAEVSIGPASKRSAFLQPHSQNSNPDHPYDYQKCELGHQAPFS